MAAAREASGKLGSRGGREEARHPPATRHPPVTPVRVLHFRFLSGVARLEFWLLVVMMVVVVMDFVLAFLVLLMMVVIVLALGIELCCGFEALDDPVLVQVKQYHDARFKVHQSVLLLLLC